MKNVISILIAYIRICIGGTIFCAFLYMVYCTCTNMVTGYPSSVFSINLFIRGIFEILPVFVYLAPLFLILLRIRHDDEELLTLLLSIFLCLIGFLTLIPASYKIKKHYDKLPLSQQEHKLQSAGFFRDDDDIIVYYSRVFPNGSVDKITYPKSHFDSYNTYLRTEYQSSSKPRKFSSEPFSDILVARSTSAPLLLKKIIEHSNIFLTNSMQAMHNGYISWLLFSSMGFSLISVIMMCRVSKWRLMNVLFVSIVTSIIFIFNYYSNCTTALNLLHFFVARRLPKFFAVRYPVTCIFNICVIAIMTTCGIIQIVIDKRQKSKDIEEINL